MAQGLDGELDALEGVFYGHTFAIVTLWLTHEAVTFATHALEGVFWRHMLAIRRLRLAHLGEMFANNVA